jgi:RimJ/RimL family protein N-acetyltransferase
VSDPTVLARTSWRTELPVLVGPTVTLREPEPQDGNALLQLLVSCDAAHLGLDEPINDFAVQQFVERAIADRAAGRAFTYLVTLNASNEIVGYVQVRQIDPSFENGEWDAALAVSVRGTGAFLEMARLAGSLAFGAVGVHRLEARVLLQNGRANGALRKLGAVQEGVLRRAYRRNGTYFDQVLWSVLREDWGEHWVATADRVH